MQTKVHFLTFVFRYLLTFTQTSVVSVTKTTFLLMCLSCHLSVRWNDILLYIIVIIIRHESGLDRHVSASSIVSSKVFQVVFVHLVYKTALFLASYCCSFLLHVVANLICIFLVSRQLVLLSNIPKFFHSFCGRKVCIPLNFWKFSSRLMSIVFILLSKGPNFACI